MLVASAKAHVLRMRLSIQMLCSYFGYSRAGYYKAQEEKHRQIEQTDRVLSLVHRERHSQPRLATDKVFRLIQEELVGQSIKMGRDKFYALLREHGMLLENKAKGPRTTDSNHSYRRYTNLLTNRDITAPNQVWVCDITYIAVGSSWMYLCLIMDAYSRKIVGSCLHDTLEMIGCRNALKQALATLPKGFDHRQLIHHSDHGVQYCCQAYRSILLKHRMQISMAAVGDCYENAQAERLNGILKQEYALGQRIPAREVAYKMVAQAIRLYNQRRPHRALQMNTPEQIHAGKKAEVRMHWPKKMAKGVAGQQAKSLESMAQRGLATVEKNVQGLQ